MNLKKLSQKPSTHRLLKEGLDLEHKLIHENYPKELCHEVSSYLLKLENLLKKSAKEDDFYSLSTTKSTKKITTHSKLSIALENVRSAYNVGSVFRNADCLGVKHIYLLGFTPGPEHSSVAKTALGACESVSWSRHKNIEEFKNCINLDNSNFFAAETSENAINIQNCNFDFKHETIIFFGNEVHGLSTESLQTFSNHVKIPMLGTKNSLNIANATAIFSFYYNLKYSEKNDQN